MENKIKRDIKKYLSECDNTNNDDCIFDHFSIAHDLKIYNLNSQIRYNKCSLEVINCKTIGYSTILNSFTHLPRCFAEEQVCINERSQNIKFLNLCYDRLT